MTVTKIKVQSSAKWRDRVIKLNVGGRPFYAYYGTLKSSSYFKNLLDGDMENVSFINGDDIFIDRSAVLFAAIMQCLRNCEVNLDENDNLEGLKNEAEYYQLYDLAESIDDLMNNPPSEKAMEYELIDLKDLGAISSITVGKGCTRPISDTYNIISTVTYDGYYWKCQDHKDLLQKCPIGCNSNFNRYWASELEQKLPGGQKINM